MQTGGNMNRQFGIITAVLLLLAVSGWAQAVHGGTITGTVTMASGERVPGVTVMVTSPALVTGERQAMSDREGRFVFLSLPPGKYNLTASLQGFNKFSQMGIALLAGENTDVKVKLQPSSYQEEVTVTAATPIVDSKSSTVSTTFTSELLEKLPTARNAFYGDVADYSQLGHGANNATLKFGGGANPYILGKNLFYADPTDSLVTKPISNWEGSATAGGPILKDKIWFYAGYDKNKSKTDTPLWIPLATWDQTMYDAKITGDFASNHRAWLAFHNEKALSGNQTWGQTWDPTMGYDQHINNNTLQAQYQWVINDRNLASAKYLGFQTNNHPTQLVNSAPGFINWWKWIGSQSIGLAGSFPYVESYKSRRKTIQADMTHYAAHFLGEHEVKFGVQYTKSQGNFEGGYFQGYANFAYPYPWDYGPAKNWWWNCDQSWCWGTKDNPVFPVYNMKFYQHPWLTRRISNETGGFVDDTWTLNDRLTFNLGMRYDEMTAKYGQGAIYQFPQTPADIA